MDIWIWDMDIQNNSREIKIMNYPRNRKQTISSLAFQRYQLTIRNEYHLFTYNARFIVLSHGSWNEEDWGWMGNTNTLSNDNVMMPCLLACLVARRGGSRLERRNPRLTAVPSSAMRSSQHLVFRVIDQLLVSTVSDFVNLVAPKSHLRDDHS